jgi:hypothetical protein
MWFRRKNRSAIEKLQNARVYLWSHKKLYLTIWTLLVGAPPIFVANYFQSSDFANNVKTQFPPIAAILGNNALIWIPLSIFWSFLLTEIKNHLVARMNIEPEGWGNAPQIILKALDSVVGHKEQRFSNHLRKTLDLLKRGKAPEPGSIFNEITQPSAQFHRLTQSIYDVFYLLCHKPGEQPENLKVNLAWVEKGQLKNIFCHYPANHPVRSSISALNNCGSGMKTAYKNRKILVVESIKDASESKGGGFVITDTARADEDGALICFPIELPPIDGEVALVISIFYPRRGVFEKRYCKKYVAILEPFALRLKLEFSLLSLKGLVENGQTNSEAIASVGGAPAN